MTLNPFPIHSTIPVDLQNQARVLPNPHASRGESAIYTGTTTATIPNLDDDPRYPKTAFDIFNLGALTGPQKNCLGRRKVIDAEKGIYGDYVWETYEQVGVIRDHLGSGLRGLQAQFLPNIEHKWKVGIWTHNRPEWQYVSLACSSQSLVLVSLYDTLGPNVVEYCINHAECAVVFASIDHIPQLLKLQSVCPTLKVIVSVDDFKGRYADTGPVLKNWGESVGIKVLDLNTVVEYGKSNPVGYNPPSRDDIASICYTSGTTGNPKGAILTHGNLAYTSVINAIVTNDNGPLGRDTVLLSYLPLSHIYGRFIEDIVFLINASIGYSTGDVLRLMEDINALKPTYFPSVPRVLNKVYNALKLATIDAPGVKGALMRHIFATKIQNYREGKGVTHPVWDNLILGKVRAVLGGRIKSISTGSAPISADVLEFLSVAFSCTVTEGYGQTENCGTATRCLEQDFQPAGTTGPPRSGVEVKLVDVPEMGYFSTDKPYPRGEICTRSGVVIAGYYKEPEKTAETIDPEGFMHSGDIAEVDEFGRFRIIDRIKNLVKLSQGEYIAVEKVENVYSLCPLILQIFVHANSLEDHLVSIIVPDPEQFAKLASQVYGKTVSVSDKETLEKARQDPKVLAAAAQMLEKVAERAKLRGFEKIKNNFSFKFDMFTMENELLTPTQKLKRNVAAKVFADELKELYAQGKGKVAAKL